MTGPDGEEEPIDREFAPFWEEVDRIAGQLPDDNVASWLARLLQSDQEELAGAETACLTVWNSKTGRMAVFRIGYRVPMLGMLDHALAIIREDIAGYSPEE